MSNPEHEKRLQVIMSRSQLIIFQSLSFIQMHGCVRLGKKGKKEAEEPMKAQKEMKNDDEFDGKQKEKANLFDQLGN